MSTALTVTGVGIASTTLATAGTMSNSTVTPPGFTNAHVLVGVATGWDEIWYNVNAGAWAAGGAIGAPSGHGFLYDVTSLEGQRILAGNWTPALRFGGLTAGTLTGTIVTRAYRRSSGGVYTLIMSSTLAAQTFAPAFSNYALPATAGSSTAFATGDKLYVDIWLNITANATGSGTATLSLGDVSNTAGNGTINCAWVTPGYALSPLDALSRFGVRQAGGDPPLTIFGLHAASTTLPTAAITGTATSGVSSSFTTLIGTATGYGELWGLGNAGAWAAGGSLPTPDGHGWILDSTLLEGQLLQAGTFTMTHRLATSAAYTTFTATLYGRAYKYNGGTYTQIGPTMSVAANLTTTTTVYTLSATMPNTYFATGDKLYFDTFLQITASTGGVGTTTVRVSNSSDATFGVANQAQLVTAGYLPGNAKDALSRFGLVKALDAVSRLRLQSGLQLKDVAARFRQQSGTTYHNILARFRLVKAVDALARFGLQPGTSAASYIPRVFGGTIKIASSITSASKDALSRFRLLATKSVDAVSRFRQQSAVQKRDAASRLRLLANKSVDQALRFRQLVVTSVSVASRLRLQSTQVLKDGLSRFRLVKALDTFGRFRLVKALDAVTRLRLQSGLIPHDLRSRLRLLATTSREVIARLRVQSSLQNKDAQLRLRLLATKSLDSLARLRLLANKSVDSMGRFRQQSGVFPHDSISRFLQQSALQSKDSQSRFRLVGSTLLGSVMRLRLLVTKSADSLSRFRQLATKSVDMQARYRQQSGLINHDLQARLRLSAAPLRDVISRLRVQSTLQSKDAPSRLRQLATRSADMVARLRLLATKSLDMVARLRLLATKSLDSPSRFRLGIPRTLDALSRFRQQSGTTIHDLQARFRLQQVGVRSLDILSRLRLQSGTTYRDALVRLRLVITPLRDIASRFRMQSVVQNKDSQGRFRQIATRSLDIVSRLRVQSAQQLKDSLARLRLLATRNADQTARFRQQSTVQRKDSQSRYRQLATKSLDAIARLRLQSSAILKDARIRFLFLVITSVSVASRLRVQSALVARDTLSRFRLQIGNPRAVGALARFRQRSGTTYRGTQARFSLTVQAAPSAGTILIELTFRDGVADQTFRDGVADQTFR